MKIINLTSHKINLISSNTILEPSGKIVRVEEKRKFRFAIHGTNVVQCCYGEPIGLPEPVEGVYLIVPADVARASRRSDLLVPIVVRDSYGNIVGVREFKIISHKEQN